MRRPRHPRGFTLVEILIVLGIIIALAGILLPALVQARESMKRTQCLNNIRQLTAAWLAYAADNDRNMCSPLLSSTSGWVRSVSDPNRIGPVRNGVLWPYLNNYTPYRCPVDASIPLDPFLAPNLQIDPYTPPSSYAINGLLNGPVGAPFPLHKLDEIANAPKTFVFIEQCNPWGPNITKKVPCSFTTPIYPAFVFSFNGWPGENHMGKSKVAVGTGISFADGHAEFWNYYDPRTGTILSGALSGGTGPVQSNGGIITYPSSYCPNSPDVFQLEAWSGGPIPPNATP